MKRRDFLKAGIAGAVAGGSGLISWVPRAQAATINKTIYITDGTITQPDGVNVYFRGYSASANGLDIPGEALIVQQGDSVNITITNTLNTPHNFVIDGVVNSGTIQPGQTRNVQFTAGSPGSYLYHDTQNGEYNRLLGLYGAMAVMPSGRSNQLFRGSRTFIQQYFWIFHEVDPLWNTALQNGSRPNTRYNPYYFTINGLSARPPGAPGAMDPGIDAMADPRTRLDGHIGDRTLIRCLNAGKVQHAIHTHGNHMEWLTSNGRQRSDVWDKDIVPLDGSGGRVDVIYPFDPPPDAWPTVNNNTLIQAENQGRHTAYPMHLHNEMTQTAGGGLYMFGALTDIYFHSK